MNKKYRPFVKKDSAGSLTRRYSDNFPVPVFYKLLVVITLVSIQSAVARAQGLQTTYYSGGLATLSYDGAMLANVSVNPYDTFLVEGYQRQLNSTTAESKYWWNDTWTVSWDASQKKVTWEYSWGNISCQYTQQGNKLTAVVTVTNNSSTATVNGIRCHPFQVHFSTPPAELDNDLVHVSWSSKEPVAIRATFNGGSMVAVHEDVSGEDVYVGIQKGIITNGTDNAYELTLATMPYWWYPNDFPKFTSSVPPQSSKTYTVSMRFGSQTALTKDIVSDLYQNYSAAHPYNLSWDDRRPIGANFLASYTGNTISGNPRNWLASLCDPAVDGDISTTTGKANFRTHLLALADNSVQRCMAMNAAGLITWDIEGQEWYHPISYIGDPTMVSDMAPEMEYKPTSNALATVDAYFKKFTDAGLAVGVTIRPQRLQRDSNGQGGYNVQQIDTADPAQMTQLLIDKATYAKNRWGCRIFYVDSNVINAALGSPPQIYDALNAAVPGCLFIPEWSTLRTYANTAPFGIIGLHKDITPQYVRDVYPNAFSYLRQASTLSYMQSVRPTLVTAVRQGDILSYDGWWDNPINDFVKGVYEDAGWQPVNQGFYNGAFDRDADNNGTSDGWNLPLEYGVAGTNGPGYVRPHLTSGVDQPYVYTDLTTTNFNLPFKLSTSPIYISFDWRDTNNAQFDTYQVILNISWQESGVTYSALAYTAWSSAGTKNTQSWRTITRNTSDGGWYSHVQNLSNIQQLSTNGHSLANGSNARITEATIRCVDSANILNNANYEVLVDNFRVNYSP